MYASVPAMSTGKRAATYQDVLDAPEHMVAEIVDGELFLSPRPAAPHAVAYSQLGAQIITFFGGDGPGPIGPGGWLVLDEPELHLGPDIMVPDVAAWRRERLPRAPRAAFISLAPDWVCEVLSPSNTRLDRTRKMPAYARHGVGHAWLVDPLAQTLEVFRLESSRWVLLGTHAGDAPVAAEPFETVPLPAARWWADVEPAEAVG